jgi:hypothetical protein
VFGEAIEIQPHGAGIFQSGRSFEIIGQIVYDPMLTDLGSMLTAVQQVVGGK